MTLKKHLFTTFFIVFLSSILMLFFFNSAILIYLSNKNLSKISSELYDSKVERIGLLLEDRLFKPLFQVVFDQLIYYQGSSILNFLLYDDSDQYTKEAYNELVREELSYEWLKSIIIYKENGQIITDMGTQRIISEPIQQILLNGTINYIKKNKNANGWIIQKSQNYKNDAILTYFVKYPVTSPSRNRGGIMYIVNSDFLDHQISKIIDGRDETLIIEDGNGMLLFSCGKKEIPRWIKETRPLNFDSSKVWKYEQNNWQVMWRSLYDQNITMGLIAPSTLFRQRLFNLQRFAITFTLSFILLCGIYLLLITKRIQIPLLGVIDVLLGMVYRGEDSVKLRSCLLEPEKIIHENKNLIIYRFMVTVITGGFEKSDFGEMCELVDLKNYRFPLRLILIESDPEDLKDLGWSDREKEGEALRIQWDGLFRDGNEISIRYPSGIITCFYFAPPGREPPLDIFEAFLETRRANIAFSAPLAATLDVPKTYSHLTRILDKKMVLGFGNIFNHEECEVHTLSTFSTEPLKKLLMGNAYEEFQSLLVDNLLRLGQNENPPIIIRDYISWVIELIAEVYHKKGGTREDLSYLFMREESQNLTNLTDIQDWIKNKIYILQDSLRYEKEEDHREIFERIRKYVEESPRKDSITQLTLAEYFGISSGFLSRLFRDFNPGGFSAFLKEIKLREAEKIIREKKEIAISDLARSLGYSSSAYFSKQFKIQYGMLPHDYARRWGKGKD